MNYFELFEMPVRLTVDKGYVSKRFFELQKKFHPDYFGQASQEEREEALELSSMVNKAYKTFQNQEETIRYVLELKGLLEEDSKMELPPDFLMEVMELNELKMDDAAAAEIQQKSQVLMEEIKEEVQPILENYEEGKTGNPDLEKVKLYYFKKKYLDRLLAE